MSWELHEHRARDLAFATRNARRDHRQDLFHSRIFPMRRAFTKNDFPRIQSVKLVPRFAQIRRIA